MEGIDRSRSQVAGLTISLRSFITSNEKASIADYDELTKNCGYAVRARPELYPNLKQFLVKRNNEFKRIISLFGGAVSDYQITDVGFSHLIEFCLKMELPESDDDLKSLSFVVFQIYEPRQVRKGGAIEIFKSVVAYLSKIEADDDADYLKIKPVKLLNVKEIGSVIKIDFKTLTYVVEQKHGLKYKKQLINKGIYTESDQIGCFRERDSGFDALCFMSTKQRIKSVLTIFGVSVDVGAGFYRQLFAEVNTLIKIKRGSNKRVVMHANANYGFVKPISEDMRMGSNQVSWVLHQSNLIVFSDYYIDGVKKLKYMYHNCALSVLQVPDAHVTSTFCTTIDNMSRLVEHKLLHFAGIGEKCSECGAIGSLDDVIKRKLPSKIAQLSISEMIAERRHGTDSDHGENVQLDDVDDTEKSDEIHTESKVSEVGL